jgi:hypothetical protein
MISPSSRLPDGGRLENEQIELYKLLQTDGRAFTDCGGVSMW